MTTDFFISNNRCQKAKTKHLQYTEEEITLNLEFYVQPNVVQQQEQNSDILDKKREFTYQASLLKESMKEKFY